MSTETRGKTETVPLARLLEDMRFYPRHDVDEAHVGRLAQALRAGAHFPAVVADRKTYAIVDGWHRVRAYKRVVGPEAVLDVEFRDYPNEAALVLDAIALNATHGRRLDRQDEIRAVILAQEQGADEVRIAAALQVPVERVQKLRIRVAYAPSESGAVTGTRTVALKRPVHHLAERMLSREQAEAHRTLPGTSFLLLADQLLLALRTDMVNRGDERLVAKLRELREELGRWLP